MADTKLPVGQSAKLKPGRREHVYAIVRIDAFHRPEVPIHKKVAVTKIMHDQADAEREVQRLNALHPDGQSYYFSQVTRLEPGPAPSWQAPASPDSKRLHMVSLVVSVDEKTPRPGSTTAAIADHERTVRRLPDFAAASSEPVELVGNRVVGRDLVRS